MIKLYVRDGCPFCIKVLKAVEKLGLVEGRDLSVVDAGPGTPGREVVVKTGGKAMVPFIIDGEMAMYESDDIIKYFEKIAPAE